MTLAALARYYDLLATDPATEIALPGYSTANVSFALHLSVQGEVLDVFPLTQQIQRGKRTQDVPRRMVVPDQVKRTIAISPNFLCDNSAYVLGVSEKDEEKPDYSRKRQMAFRELHQGLLEGVDSQAARAVLAFLGTYDPALGRSHPVLVHHIHDFLEGGNLVFMVQGAFAHDDPVIRQVWERYRAGKDAVLGQCLVTGDVGPIARLHPSLKGIQGANPTGASLVSFNARAYESYNLEQGLNSPISEKVAFAYTTALNHLLSSANPNRKIHLGDTTVTYWAESTRSEYGDTFASLFDPEVIEAPAAGQEGRKRAESQLGQVAKKIQRAQALDVDRLRAMSSDSTRFHVLGLAPNAARVSVRFYITEPFGKIADRMMQHYRDLEIIKEFDNQPTYITVRHILEETVSRKTKDKDASPLMAGAMFRSILTGAPYPAALYYAILNRIRADSDDKGFHKINYVRAAVIKASLLRKLRNRPISALQETLSMSLNEQSTVPAYVLGRLFAVLEKVQQEAIDNPNASIKDRYFTTACAAPASVFPVLLRLSQHHISKAKYGYASDRRIQDILGLLDVEKNPIPARLTLDEQGVFVLGYYHQRAAFFAPKAQASNDSVEDAQSAS